MMERPPLRANFVSEKPRRVRGGLKLSDAHWSLGMHWVARRWLDLVEAAATPELIRLGADYARKGQTRALKIDAGRINATVQGRVSPAYRVTIDAPVIATETWDNVAKAMGDQAIYAAKLLGGELPGTIDELFAESGFSLAPPKADELRTTCTCAEGQRGEKWCKHACCAALLVAQDFQRDPFLMFTLRGMPGEALIERLRERRSAGAGQNGSSQFGGVSSIPGMDEVGGKLEEHAGRFWEAGPGLSSIETPLRPPEVSHAILRRLGPSPFTEGKFPLMGLLATCYETISRWAIQGPKTPDIAASESDQEDADQARTTAG